MCLYTDDQIMFILFEFNLSNLKKVSSPITVIHVIDDETFLRIKIKKSYFVVFVLKS